MGVVTTPVGSGPGLSEGGMARKAGIGCAGLLTGEEEVVGRTRRGTEWWVRSVLAGLFVLLAALCAMASAQG